METTNFCKMVDCLSRCTLTDIKEQYKCKFFVKASKSALNQEQCSHYRPDYDDHCDSIKAQMDSVGKITAKEKDIKPDFSY